MIFVSEPCTQTGIGVTCIPNLILSYSFPRLENSPKHLGMAREEPFIAYQLTHRHSSLGKYIRAYLPREGLGFQEVRKDIRLEGTLELGFEG